MLSNFSEWITENSNDGKKKYELTNATRHQVNSLIEELCKTYGIKEVGNASISMLYINSYSYP